MENYFWVSWDLSGSEDEYQPVETLSHRGVRNTGWLSWVSPPELLDRGRTRGLRADRIAR